MRILILDPLIGVLAAVVREPNILAAVSLCGFIATDLRLLR
jgi:hypothetical protein